MIFHFFSGNVELLATIQWTKIDLLLLTYFVTIPNLKSTFYFLKFGMLFICSETITYEVVFCRHIPSHEKKSPGYAEDKKSRILRIFSGFLNSDPDPRNFGIFVNLHSGFFRNFLIKPKIKKSHPEANSAYNNHLVGRNRRFLICNQSI